MDSYPTHYRNSSASFITNFDSANQATYRVFCLRCRDFGQSFVPESCIILHAVMEKVNQEYQLFPMSLFIYLRITTLSTAHIMSQGWPRTSAVRLAQDACKKQCSGSLRVPRLTAKGVLKDCVKQGRSRLKITYCILIMIISCNVSY